MKYVGLGPVGTPAIQSLYKMPGIRKKFQDIESSLAKDPFCLGVDLDTGGFKQTLDMLIQRLLESTSMWSPM